MMKASGQSQQQGITKLGGSQAHTKSHNQGGSQGFHQKNTKMHVRKNDEKVHKGGQTKGHQKGKTGHTSAQNLGPAKGGANPQKHGNYHQGNSNKNHPREGAQVRANPHGGQNQGQNHGGQFQKNSQNFHQGGGKFQNVRHGNGKKHHAGNYTKGGGKRWSQ